MSAVAICTDSSALFPAGVAERLGVTVVPIAITLDGIPFERDDGIDDFYARLIAGARVTTSQPSPGAFLAAYTEAGGSGASEVLSIHLDARVSGTWGSADLAAREAPIPVTVVDTRTVSFGVGVCVRAAAEAIAAGASNAGDAVAALDRVGATLKNVFVAHARPRGRLSEASGWSLLEFADGKVEPGAACDALSEAIEAMAARIFEEERPLRVAVGHAAASTQPAADALALSLASMPHVVEVERYRVGPAVGAHTGALSFGVFWWPVL